MNAETASAMTVGEAWQRYSFADDPVGWHYQPVCACGDYITAHERTAPNRCGFSRSSQCRCFSYRFSRMGTGPRPEDAERWIAGGAPDTGPDVHVEN